jgi:putative heme transporter
MLGLLTAEGMLLVVSLRFVGVSVPILAVLAILFVSYPLTALPLSGLGVLDAAISVVLVDDEGADPTAVVAGLVIWRVALLVVPLLLSGLCLLLWRLSGGGAEPPWPESPEEAWT